MDNPFKTKSSKTVYKNEWIEVIENEIIHPNGENGIYSVLKTNGPSVFVIALNNQNEIYLVKLFRYPTEKWSWELPAGGTDSGEDPLVGAKRELAEETGLKANKWTQIGQYQVMNGITDEQSIVYLAQDVAEADSGRDEKEGIVEIKTVSVTKLKEMIRNGEFTDGQSIAALSYYLLGDYQ